jgi:hypothetical protein
MSIKRWTVCLARGHRWARTPYPGSEGAPDAFFLLCMYCRFENHHGTSVRLTGAGL